MGNDNEQQMTTTLQQVEELFSFLHRNNTEAGGALDEERPGDNYRGWLSFVGDQKEDIEEWYENDGHPTVFATRGTNGVKLAIYRYDGGEIMKDVPKGILNVSELDVSVLSGCSNIRTLLTIQSRYKRVDWTKKKGVIYYMHGITSNFRDEMLTGAFSSSLVAYPYDTQLYSKQELDRVTTLIRSSRSRAKMAYAKSWAEMLVEAGYVVYGPDLQGHGLSEAWRSSRCNVNNCDDLAVDNIELLKSLISSGEIPSSVPIILSGLSLGGGMMVRTLEKAFRTQAFRTTQSLPPTTTEIIPTINGAILFCPALSAERLKKKFPNRFLLPISRWLSRNLPTLRVAALEKNVLFPFITTLVVEDPLVHSAKVPVRISVGILEEMDQAIHDSVYLPKEFPLKIIQSENDTMVDPEGTQKFTEACPCTNKSFHLLHYGWHYLSREPGYLRVCEMAIDWIDETIKKLQ